uniref:Putative catabolite repression protein creC n=1 Tax=Lygus hesperus TaxID=30085 RepID=A0A0A9XYM3_LYGHE
MASKQALGWLQKRLYMPAKYMSAYIATCIGNMYQCDGDELADTYSPYNHSRRETMAQIPQAAALPPAESSNFLASKGVKRVTRVSGLAISIGLGVVAVFTL